MKKSLLITCSGIRGLIFEQPQSDSFLTTVTSRHAIEMNSFRLGPKRFHVTREIFQRRGNTKNVVLFDVACQEAGSSMILKSFVLYP